MTDEQVQTNIGAVSVSSKEHLVAVSKLLKVLTRPDALMILAFAKQGIEADSGTYSKVGMTRKRYYSRLRQLKNAGLIEKKSTLYFQTTMGSFLQENCINPIIYSTNNKKQMAMIDALKRAGNFSEEDLQRIKSSVLVQE